jgi:catechol 2,3-dioxygenase-like lactoylglutathione lyase family enzyme
MQEKCMEARVAVIGLWAEDVPLAAHFYRDVIGLKLMHHPGERPHFEVNGIYRDWASARESHAVSTAVDETL